MRTRWGCAACVLALLVPAAAAAARPRKGAGLTLSQIEVRESELPHGFRLSPSLQCASKGALAFYRNRDPDTGAEIQPKPVEKAYQTLVAGTSPTGTLFYFQYANEDLARRATGPWGELELLLHGYSGTRSATQPDEVLRCGRFLLVFSYPAGDRAAEWLKRRLRVRFRIPAPRNTVEREELADAVGATILDHRPKEGIRLLAKRHRVLEDWSYGWFLKGQLFVQAGDWRDAGSSYVRALNLSQSFQDPLGGETTLHALTGLATALSMQKAPEVAIPVLQRACAFADARGMDSAREYYELSAALVATGHFARAYHAFARAVSKDWGLVQEARSDPAFATVRDREGFDCYLN